MLFLWVFGDNIEDALGHFKFLIFYLLCGIAGGVAHAVMTPASQVPLIGASGAVAGVIAAYLVLHPKVRVWVLAFRFIPLRISAMWVLGAWVITQFVMLLFPDGSPVAWWAHIGGLIAGALLVTYVAGRRLSEDVPLSRLPTDEAFLKALMYTGALVAIWLSTYYFYGVLARGG